MSDFINELAQYVRSELVRALGPAAGQELRIFFSGPPLEILDELFKALATEGEFLLLQEAGRSIRLPVFVLDAGAADPDRLRSARCTPSFLVKVRTSECPVFLALHPPNESSVLSLESATTRIGMSSQAEDLESWLAHPLIRVLVDAGLRRVFGGSMPPGARECLSLVLEEAWRADESFKDHRNAWQVLRRLSDCEILDATPEETFLATLGLPACDGDEFGKPEHLKLLGRIGDLLENAGFGPGLDQVQEQAEKALQGAVADFRQHLLARCMTASQFSWSPAEYYRPVNWPDSKELPTWWRILTVEAWNRLLDSSPDPNPQEGLRASCSNPLTPIVRGTPVLLLNRVEVDVLVPGQQSGPITVSISRASGAKQLEPLASIAVSPGTPFAWSDDDVLLHDRYVRYQFEAAGYKSVALKCIVLDRYAAGIGLYCRNATKITPFKVNRKARDAQNRKIDRLECEIALHGIGAHQLDFYKGSQVTLGTTIAGYEVDSGHESVLRRPINLTDDHHAVCVIETDEECFCEFEADPLGEGTFRPYRVWITANDESPTGAASEFDRLLIEHRASANGERVTARVESASSRATDLQIWAIEDEESYHPLALGPDYVECWRKPAWANRPVFSAHTLMLDPRPPIGEFIIPPELLEARRCIQAHLRPAADEPTSPIEMIRLGEMMSNDVFADCLSRYVRAYLDWLRDRPQIR